MEAATSAEERGVVCLWQAVAEQIAGICYRRQHHG